MGADARDEILERFEAHRLVGLAEEHGSERQHAFVRSLLRSPRLPGVVNDVVVEFGTARYQDVMDAYVAGAAVDARELERAWCETTQRDVWRSEIYAAFFRTVREVNGTLPAGQRVRVLLGDPPIRWEHVEVEADVEVWIGRRNRHFADVVEREVLDHGRRALLVAGAFHLFHRMRFNETALLKRRVPEGVYVVLLEPTGAGRANALPLRARAEPSLHALAGTPLGDVSLARLVPPGEAVPPTRIGDVADAYLHLGGDR